MCVVGCNRYKAHFLGATLVGMNWLLYQVERGHHDVPQVRSAATLPGRWALEREEREGV